MSTWEEQAEHYKKAHRPGEYANPSSAVVLSDALSYIRTYDGPIAPEWAFMGYVYSQEMAAIREKTKGE